MANYRVLVSFILMVITCVGEGSSLTLDRIKGTHDLVMTTGVELMIGKTQIFCYLDGIIKATITQGEKYLYVTYNGKRFDTAWDIANGHKIIIINEGYYIHGVYT